jgi:hypothetical protein
VLKNDYTLNVDAAWTRYKIPLDEQETIIGSNDFIISNGSILVNSNNVHYVKLSGNLNIWQGPNTQEVMLHIIIYRNNELVFQKTADSQKNGLCSLSISPAIRDVRQGDKIEMYYEAGTAGTYIFIGRKTHTFLTVEKIY